MPADVVDLPDRHDEADLLEATCANPKCDERFMRTVAPGRRKDFHNEDCRRSAERDFRRLSARLDHYSRQADQMRARIAAYLRTSCEDSDRHSGPSAVEIERARLAVAEVRGMARFLPNHQGEFARDLLKLYQAVEPLVNSGTASPLSVPVEI